MIPATQLNPRDSLPTNELKLTESSCYARNWNWNRLWGKSITFPYVAHFRAQFREIYQKESACQSYLSNFV